MRWWEKIESWEFGAQFRWEEGDLVFRYRQRGEPIRVSPAERDRALRRYLQLKKRVEMAFILAVLLAGVVPLVLDPSSEVGPILLGGMAISLVTCLMLLQRWAWDAPTLAWRGRRSSGLPLAGSGGLLMQIERMSWRLIGWSWAYLLVLGLAWSLVDLDKAFGGWTVAWWLLAVVGGWLLIATALKVALSERQRLRRKRIGAAADPLD